ncbi:hypothetical protein [Pseudoalteromonas umbrosa]|uniref:hypothetical protein n=1 Tax=Pseudoalteromonas umbrosa TaxID=3048489 RepID=UPI0024C2DFC9|nr:hypothetical protein [Pseudoalteromonas sp. B95]MDK1290076.1 hypothetical protein [Pseudoalteromonas sp. B95]
MHVVLKRRGVILRATWDGLQKPAQFNSAHWVRMSPSKAPSEIAATPKVANSSVMMNQSEFNAFAGVAVSNFVGGSVSMNFSVSARFAQTEELNSLISPLATDAQLNPWRYIKLGVDKQVFPAKISGGLRHTPAQGWFNASYTDTFVVNQAAAKVQTWQSANVTSQFMVEKLTQSTLQLGHLRISSNDGKTSNAVQFNKRVLAMHVYDGNKVQFYEKSASNQRLLTNKLGENSNTVMLNAQMPSESLFEPVAWDADHHLPAYGPSSFDKDFGEATLSGVDPLFLRAKPTHYIRHNGAYGTQTEIFRDTPYTAEEGA